MLEIDLKSKKSIYEQVIDRLKELIVTGAIGLGDKLPSVRELSANLAVNPNTIQKAYRELERQGYVYTVSGLGTFAADISGIQIDPTQLGKAKNAVAEAFRQLLYLGLDREKAFEEAVSAIRGVMETAGIGEKTKGDDIR